NVYRTPPWRSRSRPPRRVSSAAARSRRSLRLEPVRLVAVRIGDVLDRRPRLRELAIALLFLGASAIFTYPLSTKITTRFYASSDPSTYAWGLWWFKHQLFHLKNPWYASSIFAPHGALLAFSAYVPLAGFLLSPLTW